MSCNIDNKMKTTDEWQPRIESALQMSTYQMKKLELINLLKEVQDDARKDLLNITKTNEPIWDSRNQDYQ